MKTRGGERLSAGPRSYLINDGLEEQLWPRTDLHLLPLGPVEAARQNTGLQAWTSGEGHQGGQEYATGTQGIKEMHDSPRPASLNPEEPELDSPVIQKQVPQRAVR